LFNYTRLLSEHNQERKLCGDK